MMDVPFPLSHAYLITGGNPDSRAALADRLTAAYLCVGEHPPCGQCRPCRKVSANIHPDVSRTVTPPDKQEITVEQIRALRSDAYIRPNEGKRKVYCIDPADAMNPSAQNALLKVLEEGPAYAAFLLLADRPGLLLDTVRSRCELLTLPPEAAAPDPVQLEQAKELARLFLTGDELSMIRHCAKLELSGMKSGQLSGLLVLTEGEISRRLTQYPQRGAQVLQALKTCRENAVFTPSVGNTLGWLTAVLNAAEAAL